MTLLGSVRIVTGAASVPSRNLEVLDLAALRRDV